MERDWQDRIERRLTAIELRHAVEQVHRENVAQRLGAIEDALKWLVRLVGGGFLMALLAFVLQGGLSA